jgi:catechol 2,3-dioxygenase-like lactoylglutathione lyase family enzyme
MSFGEVRNFDYAILLCSKIKETRDFYRDVLGFPIEHDLENWVSFRVGSALLTLRPRGRGLAWDDGPAAPGSAAVQLAFPSRLRRPTRAMPSCLPRASRS